ncbi:hypothetical protein NM688_g6850 [Phlebia brevispora]|uniref:Uncharacterized protein n=1 Tax=Phlebia brevispora TaxID=194682 RepID=A0ACC1SBR4_9APHY|nr:hypothetical protein NM688_g6850 [Phlebia brevispora]
MSDRRTERIDYYTDFKRLVRTDPITRVVLLSLKDPHKDHPLLPLESDDIEAFKGSALYGTVTSDDDLSEVVSNLMGPGPWSVRKNIELPKSCSDLHFTNKNKKSNIVISHTLKVIFRVQRGDDQELDATTGKRKMFDIVVQTPIHILSCLCGPDYTALPPYSEAFAVSTSVSAQCLCRSGSILSSSQRENTTTSPSDSGYLSPDSASLSRAYTGVSLTSSESLVTATVRPPLPHFDSMLNSSSQFERLISGHESESGEAPPSYEEVATLSHHPPTHS